EQIVSALLKQKIAVSSAQPFACSDHVPHALRLALGSVEPEALEGALQVVSKVIRDHTF
ncbi:MAG: hypothetical protein JO338_03695, partial [Aquitalea sp.]|nr:hypothetical protein [Aquitalea sp.]